MGDLSAQERAEVEAYVQAHPEWAAALATARRFWRLMEAAAPPQDASDDLLAAYAAAQHVGGLRPEEEAYYQPIRAAIDADPDVSARYTAMAARLDALHAASDPAAHFERLAGFSPDAVDKAPLRLVQGSARVRGSDRPTDRAPKPVLRLLRTRMPMSLAAGLAVVLLYGGLFVGSRALQPAHERLAALGSLPDSYAQLSLGTRGVLPLDTLQQDAATTSARYRHALETIAAARKAPLGLFPSYDAALLEAAVAELNTVIVREPPTSPLALEATFVIGKVRLYQNRWDEARRAFETVVREQGPSAPEARRLLANGHGTP